MPYCSGICKRYKYVRKYGDKWYANGVKRCNFCSIFMKVAQKECPCCKTTLRTQGRGSDVKRKRELARI